MKIKVAAAQAGVQSLTMENGQILVRLGEGHEVDPVRIGHAVPGTTVQASQVQLDVRRLGGKWQQPLEVVLAKLA